MPILDFLIMLLHIIRYILDLLPLFVEKGRLLARRHGWMGLVRGDVGNIVHFGTLGVMGSFMSRGGVGLPRGRFFLGFFMRFGGRA